MNADAAADIRANAGTVTPVEITGATKPPQANKDQPLQPTGPQVAESQGPAAQFAGHHFREGAANMPATSPDGRRVISERGAPPEVAEFNKELIDGLRGFAEKYVAQIIRLNSRNLPGQNVSIYEAMKRQQRTHGITPYLEDDLMLETFTTRDPQTGERKVKTVAEINNLFSSRPRLIENVMLVAERYTRDALAATGVRAELRGAGHRTDPARIARVIDFPIDQGIVNKGVRRVVNWLRAPLNERGRGDPGMQRWLALMTTAEAGAVAGGILGPEGAAAGAILGPILAAAAARLGRNGVRLALEIDPDVLARAQGQGERIRAEYLIGVNPTDPLHSVRLGNAVGEALGLINLRAIYMKSLNVPAENMDVLTDQFLNIPGQRPEETDENLRNEIIHRFAELGGWNAPNLDAQRDILEQAKEAALVHNWEQDLRATNKPAIDELARLDAAITARQDGGTTIQERTRLAREEQAGLQADKTSIEATTTSLNAYQEKLNEAENARRELETAIGGITRGGATFPDLAATIAALRETLGTPGTADTIILDENGIPVNVPAIAGEAAEIAAIPPRGAAESEKTYNARFDAERTRIRERYQENRRLVQAQIHRLQTLQVTAQTIGKEAADSEETTNGTQTLTDISEAFTAVNGIGGGVLALLPAGDLHAIMAAINTEHAANPAVGWPANENTLPENREAVHRAIIQARTNALMHDPANIPNHVDLENSFNAVANNPAAGQRINATLLRAMTIAELTNRANQLGAGAIIPELVNAKQWTMYQLEYMQRSIQEETRLITNAETIEARRIRNVNPENEIAQLEMVRDIYQAADSDVKGRANYEITTLDTRNILRNIDHAVVADGYTASEVASNLPRNVLEIINILTNYQNATDRNAAFDRIWRNIGSNPDLLLGLLNRSFTDLTNAPDIDIFSSRLRTAVGNNRIDAPRFYLSVRRTVDELIAWSKTI